MPSRGLLPFRKSAAVVCESWPGKARAAALACHDKDEQRRMARFRARSFGTRVLKN
tara:strand:+ start:532 stop:699 length:168 start_codon:yes stop_codon:yes gene_type:complete